MEQGFFELGVEIYRPPSIVEKQKSGGGKKRAISPKNLTCEDCKLYTDCDSPKMKYQGEGRLKVLLIGEVPSARDDSKGKHFSDRHSRYLETMEDDLGISIEKDCWTTFAVSCYSPKEPTIVQLNACSPRLLRTIKRLQPHVIVPMGLKAVQGLIGQKLVGRIKGVKYPAFFSEAIPDREFKAWICPTYSPSFLSKIEKNGEMLRIFNQDMKRAFSLVEKELPIFPENIQTTQDEAEAIEWIKTARKSQPALLSFDYETTGLKPHREGHKIVCAGIAYGKEGLAQGFPFFESAEFIFEWRKLLASKKVGLCAHKADFEATWSKVRGGGKWPNQWEFDTCLAAHCLSNQKPTGLKFQAYVNLGVIGWDDGADQYITKKKEEEDPKSSNSFVKTEEAPLDELLVYVAKDALYSHHLAKVQAKKLSADQWRGFNLLLEGTMSLAKAQDAGMRISVPELSKQKEKLSKRIARMEKKIFESEEVKKWPREEFNYNSPKQLTELLYEILKFKKPKGSPTDEGALKKLGQPFTDQILAVKKLKKMRDTYLEGFNREQVNGIVRPFFNLHRVKTFRSSSDSPNFQNIPKRDKAAQKIIRSIIHPSSGNRLVEYDYKGIEVCFSACIHKDPSMIRYIEDPSTDMHRDVAKDMFLRGKNDWRKEERQAAKNGFVFPSFYGSSSRPQGMEKVGSMTLGIWEQLDEITKAHLKSRGIKNIYHFQKHIEEIERIFWEERFPVYNKWKSKTWKKFQRDGFIDLVTGFRCYGPIKYTELINIPIQGPAFHGLLWTMIHAAPEIEALSGRSHLIGQIHDAAVGDIHPDEESEVDAIMKKWGEIRIRKHFPWIIVPLTLEKERSEIDGSWAEMTDCGSL